MKDKKEKCKTCGGVEVVSDGQSCWYNCEMGGSDCEGMTKGVVDNKDACDRCGKTVPCPECMPVANKYYLLWIRDNTNMNFAHRKTERLEEQMEKRDKALKGFLEIQQWCKDLNVKSYGKYQSALDERMAVAKEATKETIQYAAIIRSDGILAKDKSHPIIINRCPMGTCKKGSKMGFLTSKERFVDRVEALQIALDANQINKDMDTIRQGGLLSENLWDDSGFKFDYMVGYYKE